VTISFQQDDVARASRAPIMDVEGVASWRFEDTFQAGFYDVELPEDDLPTTKFAFNLPVSDESRLDRFPVADLPGQFQQSLIIGTNSDRDQGKAVTPLFRALLGVLLALLLIENYLAWFLGNARR
jgi:hypothetical protein